MTPFVTEGVEAGQPVFVAFRQPTNTLVRAALGPAAARVGFGDMEVLSRNPTRMVDAVRELLTAHAEAGPVRIVGEVIWPTRPAAEVAEAQLTEALLNITVHPDSPVWMVCCYHTGMTEEVITQAHRTHPVLVEGGSYRGSCTYGGRAELDDLFTGMLPAPPAQARPLDVERGQAETLAEAVGARASAVGVSRRRSADLAASVRHLVSAGIGTRLLSWREPDGFVCQLDDLRRLVDPTVGHRGSEPEPGRGWALAQAHRLADLVQVRSGPAGTTVRIRVRAG